ncbi:TPA: glutaredoxin family protein [Candidatus Woesearchaeota archaeon]|nr:glutaredoxin family protein [Candidatus Woesearchaeota archaeon]HIH12216.1 glutaredoxin family protein [Candidatus Woesearchaeota archaeon]
MVKIYTTPTCPWCVKTKEFLKGKKIKFSEYNVVDDAKARDEMLKKSGQMGVPVLDIDGKIIVGFDPAGIEKALGTVVKKK